MTGFALLWQKTLYSSLWVNESKDTRLLFITMLMLKNSDGVVQASLVGLADAAKITPEECKVALKALLAPDPDDSSKVEEGRRVKEVPGGWQIVNADLYRFSTEAKRAFWAQQKAEQRAREPQSGKKPARRKKGLPLPGETASIKLAETHGQAVADEHQERTGRELEANFGSGGVVNGESPASNLTPEQMAHIAQMRDREYRRERGLPDA